MEILKLGFSIDVRNGFPPFDVEHIFVHKFDEICIVKNYPFFLQNISFEDKMLVNFDSENYVTEFKLIEKSNFSNIQIYLWNLDFEILNLKLPGCDIEGAPLERFYAVNIANDVDISKFCSNLKLACDQRDLDYCLASIRNKKIYDFLS